MMASERPVRTITVDTRTYRLLAVQKVVHRFTGSFRIQISRIDDHSVAVHFEPRSNVPLTGSPLLADFENELLDQELREVVGAETQAVRNLILAQAFSATNLLDPVGESADYPNDPLGIGRPDKAGQ